MAIPKFARSSVIALVSVLACSRAERATPTEAGGLVVDAEGPAPPTATKRASSEREDASVMPPVDPACEGASLPLIATVSDERCAISDGEWRATAEAMVSSGLARAIRPRASVTSDAVLVFTLVNAIEAPVDVPLRFREGEPQLEIIAEEPSTHALYELAAPRPLPDEADAGPRTADPRRALVSSILDAGGTSRVRSARVRLAPKGSIHARYVVDSAVHKRLKPPCDAGLACGPARLVGRFTLHVGHFFVDLGEAVARVDATLR